MPKTKKNCVVKVSVKGFKREGFFCVDNLLTEEKIWDGNWAEEQWAKEHCSRLPIKHPPYPSLKEEIKLLGRKLEGGLRGERGETSEALLLWRGICRRPSSNYGHISCSSSGLWITRSLFSAANYLMMREGKGEQNDIRNVKKYLFLNRFVWITLE